MAQKDAFSYLRSRLTRRQHERLAVERQMLRAVAWHPLPRDPSKDPFWVVVVPRCDLRSEDILIVTEEVDRTRDAAVRTVRCGRIAREEMVLDVVELDRH